jgi:hypothetical protein
MVYDLYTYEELYQDAVISKPWYNGGKVGLVNQFGASVLPVSYDEISFYMFSPEAGQPLVWGISDSLDVKNYYEEMFKPIRIRVKKEGKFGIVDLYGKPVVPCIYSEVILTETEGLYFFNCRKDDGNTDTFDIDGVKK